MMSDVCRKDRVSQALSLRNDPTALTARLRVASSRATLSANSLSVSSALVPSASGRCSGMPKAESPDQMPCRSGSPQGVLARSRSARGRGRNQRQDEGTSEAARIRAMGHSPREESPKRVDKARALYYLRVE